MALSASEETNIVKNLFNIQKEMMKNAVITTQIDEALLDFTGDVSTPEMNLNINDDLKYNDITSEGIDLLQSQLDMSNYQISMCKNENEVLTKNHNEKLFEINNLVISFTSKLDSYRVKELKQISDNVEMQVFIDIDICVYVHTHVNSYIHKCI
jgi:hypothetical protein